MYTGYKRANSIELILKDKEYIHKSLVCLQYTSVSQIRYSLVVILELNSVSEVQYKDMMIDRWWKVSTEIIDVVKSKV